MEFEGFKCTCTNCGRTSKPADLVFNLTPLYEAKENTVRTETMKRINKQTGDKGAAARIRTINTFMEELPYGPFKRVAGPYKDFSDTILQVPEYRYTFEAYRNEMLLVMAKFADITAVVQWSFAKVDQMKKESTKIVGELASGFSEETRVIRENILKAKQDAIQNYQQAVDGLTQSLIEADNKEKIIFNNVRVAEEIIALYNRLTEAKRALDRKHDYEWLKDRRKPTREELNQQLSGLYLLRYAFVKRIREALNERKKEEDAEADFSGIYFRERYGKPEDRLLNEILRGERGDILLEIQKLLSYVWEIDPVKADVYLFDAVLDAKSSENGFIPVGSVQFSEVKDGPVVRDRRCPHCNNRMVSFAGAYKEIVLALAGNPRVSKSTTIAAAVHFLQELGNCTLRTDEEFGEGEVGKEGSGDFRWKVFRENYLERYKMGARVQATSTKTSDIPKFSVALQFNGREQVILTIIDIPGEYEKQENYPAIIREYKDVYSNIDFVWICTDVLELSGETTRQNSLDAGYDEGAKPSSIMESLARWQNSLSPISMIANSKKKPKAMLIVGKTDLVENEIERDRYELFTTGEEPYFEWIDGKICVNERYMFDKMTRWRGYVELNCSQLLDYYERVFDGRLSYCSMSAYGKTPTDDNGSLAAKYMAGWPMMWMLIVKNWVELKYKKQTYKKGLFGKKKLVSEEFLHCEMQDSEICTNNMTMHYREGTGPVYEKHIIEV